MREENPKIEVVVWRLGREKAAAAEPRRCRRRGREKNEEEGGGKVFRVRGRREADILKK